MFKAEPKGWNPFRQYGRPILKRANAMAGAGRGIAGNPLTSALKRRLSEQRAKRQQIKKRKSSIPPQGIVEQDGMGGSVSKTHYGTRQPYLPLSVVQTLAPHRYAVNGASQLICGVNAQNAATALIMYKPSTDVNNFMGIAGLSATKVPKILCVKQYGEISMTNAMLSNAQITIYDCVARKDLVANSALPETAWSQGDSEENASSQIAILGQEPYESETFNQFWKVIKTTRLVLGQGAVHRHCVSGQPNRILSNSYTREVYGIQGLTQAVLVQLHGQPSNDSVTQTQVRSGNAVLNMIYKYEYDFKILQSNTTELTYVDNLSTKSFTVAEQLVDEGSGTIVTNAEG